MDVKTLTQTLNTLVEAHEFALAEQIAVQYPHYHQDIPFNDVYATILYFLDKYEQALTILNVNFNLLLQTENEEAYHWLISTYFQKANCYQALHQPEKAQYYYKICLCFDVGNAAFHQEIVEIMKQLRKPKTFTQ